MARSQRQIVLAFDERADKSGASLRGGKGSNLARMCALNLPVPSGFTVTTTVARAYQEHQRYPKRLMWQVNHQLQRLERLTGKKFGDPKNPLLLSVRSGAEVSMPGMMDTVLNLGMTDDICAALTETVGASFANACYSRLRTQMGDAFSNDPHEQLWNAIDAVSASWQSERAVAYRAAHNISDTLGTAITVQAMVFGNRDERSGTGVVFSRDPNTGQPGLYGEFLPCAQGEDVVSGSRTPMPITALEAWDAGLYQELASYAQLLENELDAIADIEFTIESGTLYLLQCRKAKLTPVAAVTFAVHRQWDKRWTREQAVESVTSADVESISHRSAFTQEAVRHVLVRNACFGQGIAASPGAVSGMFASTLEGALKIKARGGKVVLIRPDTSPNDLPAMLAADAIVTLSGGATSHAAVVARQLGIPAVVGFTGNSDTLESLARMYPISVCGTSGNVYLGTLDVEQVVATKEVNIFRKWLEQQKPHPRINFAAVHERRNTSSMLVDVYLSEAMEHAARGTALAQETSALAQKVQVETAEYFACYLTIAVASELRHYTHSRNKHRTEVEIRHAGAFLASFGITNEYERGDEAILATLKPLSIPEQALFFSRAEHVFRAYSWSSSFGGEKWADIAQAGHAFLSGAWPHGLFVDRVFDLRHNTGRVFDKHPMVSDNGYLDCLLELKKEATTIDALMLGFRDEIGWGLTYWRKCSPIDEVAALWEKGRKAGLWKKEITK